MDRLQLHRRAKAAVGVEDANACARAPRRANEHSVGGDRAVCREKVSAWQPAQKAAVSLRHEVNAFNRSATGPITFTGKALAPCIAVTLTASSCECNVSAYPSRSCGRRVPPAEPTITGRAARSAA